MGEIAGSELGREPRVSVRGGPTWTVGCFRGQLAMPSPRETVDSTARAS